MNKHWSNIRRVQSGTHQIVMPTPDSNDYRVLLKLGSSLNASPLVQRLRPTPANPLPVYCTTIEELEQLLSARRNLLARDGLVLDSQVEETTPSHVALYYDALNKNVWPFPKMAVEIASDKAIYSYIFEACDSSDNQYRPLTASECQGRKIADIKAIKVHMLYRDSDSERVEVLPYSWVYYPFLAQMYDAHDKDEDREFVAVVGLESNNIAVKNSGKETPVPEMVERVKKMFPGAPINHQMFDVRPEDKQKLKNYCKVAMNTISVLLHALQRNPEWVMQDNSFADVEKANRLRRGLGKSQLSAIHIINVNPDTLQRIEKQLPTDIQHALEDKGAYHIEGLVLVRAFEKKNGTKVKAHARCADETVRTLATEILQTEPVNYQDLAEVVRAWGNRSTVARMMQSTITQVKVVRPSASQQVATPSEKPEP